MKTIITIDGIDGSGKSRFAQRLLVDLAEAGSNGVLVRVDDFRRAVDWTEVEREASVYYDSYFDLELCDRCLTAFITGVAGVTIPMFDPVIERISGDRAIGFAGASVAVVEGVFPLRIPTAAAGFVIYLDATLEEARRRVIERDLGKGRTREEIERRIDRRYFPSQERYRSTFRPREHADVVIDNELPRSPRAIRRDLTRVAEPVCSILDRVLPPLVR